MAEYKDCPLETARYERLAAYEATGLTPEEATAIRHTLDEYHKVADPLLRAQADGRLVVLPCKVGDTMWLTASYYTERLLQPMEARVVRIKIDAGDEITYATTKGIVRNKNFGKTVFLTREEAEKALEVMKDG